jgi:pimeloyl-ACP methyl ester carboxylesterase
VPLLSLLTRPRRSTDSHSRRRSVKKSQTQVSVGVLSGENEFSKIPTIPAEIRTSPFPVCSLLTVVNKGTAFNKPDITELQSSGVHMFRHVATIVVALLLSAPLVAEVIPFPASFHTQMVPTNGTSLYVRVGGTGPAVVLLHGFGFTGDMWAPLAIVLAKDHTVIVPDLRGMGMSNHPDTGYTKKNQAVDIAGVLDALKIQKADLVTHDIGNMVGYALAAQYPDRVTRWVVIDAPLPGIGDWDNIVRSPMLWHFDFRGPDEERLVQGRERIYLDRFWNELSGDPKGIDEDTRQHYAALYARPHAMHDAFEQFGAFSQDAADNKALLAKGGKITMPVFAIGAEKFFGKGMADEMRFAASNVTGGIVPNSGHWIMEENPQATIKLVTDFLAK